MTLPQPIVNHFANISMGTGEWDRNFQSPTGSGQQTVNLFTQVSLKFKDEPLRDQMRKRIMRSSLILPGETF